MSFPFPLCTVTNHLANLHESQVIYRESLYFEDGPEGPSFAQATAKFHVFGVI